MTVKRPDPGDLARARDRLRAVTDWIAARGGSGPPDPAAVNGAAIILAAPPADRDISLTVDPATVYHVQGHLVAVYRLGSRVGAVAAAECSCEDSGVCEHLLAVLACELPLVASERSTP
jgi:hypothetical protein